VESDILASYLCAMKVWAVQAANDARAPARESPPLLGRSIKKGDHDIRIIFWSSLFRFSELQSNLS
jgi:hypothetical protein